MIPLRIGKVDTDGNRGVDIAGNQDGELNSTRGSPVMSFFHDEHHPL